MLIVESGITYLNNVPMRTVLNGTKRGIPMRTVPDGTIHIPRIMLAATKSGSGKTLITSAFLEEMKERGKKVQAFKCGPDYIDPKFHETVTAVPCVNLDTWFTDHKKTRELFCEHVSETGADLAVIEGVMGLYDGLGGTEREGSSYDLAAALQCPIILIIDAKGMGLSMEAEISGFLSMDTQHLIRGVILNRTSKTFCNVMKQRIGADLPVQVIGCFPQDKALHLDSRHLGLMLPEEVEKLQDMERKAAGNLREASDLNMVQSIAESAPDMRYIKAVPAPRSVSCKIGVAMDEAFDFYYEDNLRLLEEMGAEIVPFSPIRDSSLPKGIDGMYLGGGYPELYARELSENTTMRSQIRTAVSEGLPTIAECGGFMYLHDRIRLPNGEEYPLAGVVNGTCFYTGHLVRFGYMELREKKSRFLKPEEAIRGHEFHYYDSDCNGDDCTAVKPVSGRSWDCVHETDHSFWGFPHLYWPSCPGFAERFLDACQKIWPELN